MISVEGVIARPALQRKSEGRHRASVGELEAASTSARRPPTIATSEGSSL